ncbi:hypothetical protein VULLAG_LOCUS9724 [Vulpes lagopus]
MPPESTSPDLAEESRGPHLTPRGCPVPGTAPRGPDHAAPGRQPPPPRRLDCEGIQGAGSPALPADPRRGCPREDRTLAPGSARTGSAKAPLTEGPPGLGLARRREPASAHVWPCPRHHPPPSTGGSQKPCGADAKVVLLSCRTSFLSSGVTGAGAGPPDEGLPGGLGRRERGKAFPTRVRKGAQEPCPGAVSRAPAPRTCQRGIAPASGAKVRPESLDLGVRALRTPPPAPGPPDHPLSRGPEPERRVTKLGPCAPALRLSSQSPDPRASCRPAPPETRDPETDGAAGATLSGVPPWPAAAWGHIHPQGCDTPGAGPTSSSCPHCTREGPPGAHDPECLGHSEERVSADRGGGDAGLALQAQGPVPSWPCGAAAEPELPPRATGSLAVRAAC